jgi:hypothetical protein
LVFLQVLSFYSDTGINPYRNSLLPLLPPFLIG